MEYQENRSFILLYTREVLPTEYPDGLARSIHMAYSRDGIHFEALHQNYGILFAEATICADDTISPKCVKNPWVYELPEGGYGIIAERVNEDGSVDGESDSKVLFWKTEDFIEFQSFGLVPCSADLLDFRQDLSQLQGAVLPKGAVEGNVIEVRRSLCDRIVLHWSRIHNTEVCVPESIWAASEEELTKVWATAIYSDGSTSLKQVKWETEGIDFQTEGIHEISGTVQNIQYEFPLAKGYGDPVIFPWEGKYYFIATNDNLDDIGLYVRVSEDVDGLFAEGVMEHLILGRDEEGKFWQTFWAPEFHVIGGELYILFAVSDTNWGPQCHLMKLKKNGDILNPADWSCPIRIRKADGSWLTEVGITLDMTYLKAGMRSYMIWSYRRHTMSIGDTGSMLYIATVNEEDPSRLTSEPVLLSRPLFGWENVNGTINNEGPYTFVKEDTIYLTYSGGAANSYTYVLGLFTAKMEDDLLDPMNWKKSNVPVLSFYSVEGEYGPGHNSFFTDAQGNLMIAYHAETDLESTLRCDGIRRVHFDIHGQPVFDMSVRRDLCPDLKKVKTRLITGRKKDK